MNNLFRRNIFSILYKKRLLSLRIGLASSIIFVFVVSMVTVVSNVIAATNPTIKSVSLNSGTSWTNSTNGEVLINPNTNKFTASVTVTTGSSTNYWKSTSILVAGETVVCFSTNHSTGTFTDTYTLNQPSSQGKYDITFKAYDQDNCTGTGTHVSSTFTINSALIIDTTAPTNPSSIVGSIVGSTIHITWPGTGPNAAKDNASGVAGFSYKFTSSPNSDADSDLNLSASATSVSSDGLKNGTYYFHLKTKDIAGNWSNTVHLGPFTVNVSPLDSPKNLHYVINDGDDDQTLACGGYTNRLQVRPTWSSVTGAASYEILLDSDDEVQVSDNDHSINVGNATQYDWSLGTNKKIHKFKVRAIDAYGNHGNWSQDCSITIDQTAPLVDAGSDHLANVAFTQEDSSASDDSGISSHAWTKVSGPGTVSITSSNILHPTFSADTDGTYVVRLTVTDNAGNTASDTFTFEWDTTKPAAPDMTRYSLDDSQYDDEDEGISCGGITNLLDVMPLWKKVQDATGYDIIIDNGDPISLGNSNHYSWQLPAGDTTHTFRVRAIDAAGNPGDWSQDCSITIDQTAPLVDAGSDHLANVAFTQEDSSASDDSGISSHAWTKVSGPGTVSITSSNILHPTFSADTDGTYVVRLTVTDNAGNTASDTFTFEWDTTKPQTSFDTVPNQLSRDTSPTFTFDVSDNRSQANTIKVECSLDEGQFVECVSPFIPSVTEGSHSLVIRLIDEAGNEYTDTYMWFVDITAPVIHLVGESPMTIVAGNAYTDQGATATDNHDNDLTSKIEAINNVNSNKPGMYTVVYNLSDAAGNVAASVTRIVMVYDNNLGTTPVIESQAPNNGDVNQDGIPDNVQAEITSFVNPITNQYSALENKEKCDNVTVTQKAISDLSKADGDYKYPAGLMNFTLQCGEERAGLTVTVVQYYFGLSSANLVLRKYNETTNTYTLIPGATFEDVTVDGMQATKVTYQITDGGLLDEDGLANGTIVDPSGPATVASPLGNNDLQSPNTGIDPQSFSQYILSGIVGLGLMTLGLVLSTRSVKSSK